MGKFQSARIGILGGSFDPAHKGHLTISKLAIKKLKLKKVYWLITKKGPFKKKSFFALKTRLEQSKRLVKNIKKIKVIYLEEIVKSSKSIDIIRYLIKTKKIKNIYFIIGSDILREFHKWKSWKKIAKLTKLIVFYRKGYDTKSIENTVADHLKKNNSIFIKNKPIEISSSLLRKKLKIKN